MEQGGGLRVDNHILEQVEALEDMIASASKEPEEKDNAKEKDDAKEEYDIKEEKEDDKDDTKTKKRKVEKTEKTEKDERLPTIERQEFESE